MNFYDCLINDKLVNEKISAKDLKKMFDLNYYIKRINVIYKRVFK